MMCALSRVFVVVVLLEFCCNVSLAQDNDWLEAKLIKSEVKIKKKQKIAMLSHHPKQYKILMEVRPDKSGAQWGNIIQFTPGGIKATPFGNHIATVFYHGMGQQLMVTSSISGVRDFHSYKVIAPERWHTVEIAQEKLGGDYYYSVSVDGHDLNHAINNKTEMLTNVTVFAGAPWYESVPGSIRKLSFFYKARCVDTGKNCKEYAAGDYCIRYKEYMQKSCKVTCGFCDNKPAPAALKRKIEAKKAIDCNRNNGGCNQLCQNNKCQCRKGYKLASDLRTCSDVNECRSSNGGCDHKCINTAGSFRCGCKSGYNLRSDGRGCRDIDECAASSTTCEHICTNTRGGYRCTCVEGYTLVNNKKCTYDCPPLVPVPGCASDPCRTTTCPRNSNAICKTNFCGGCNARFYTKSGKKVECSTKRKPCKDISGGICARMQRKGFCTRFKDFMSEKCRKSCRHCSPAVAPKRVTPAPRRPDPIHRPVNGNWGRWSGYGSCSKSCDSGTQTRARACNNPAPANGGRRCQGSASDGRSCNTRSCPAPVVAPTKKTSVSACTKYDHSACDHYVRQKSYYCSRGWVKNNCPQMCGSCTRQAKKITIAPKTVAPVVASPDCGVDNSVCTSYESIKSYACTQQWMMENCKQMCGHCKQTVAVVAVNGNWGRWSAYGRCSRTCGGGTQERTRVCDNPAPSNGGASCAGRDSESQSCGNAACRVAVNGNWGRWSAYGRCSRTCGGGTQERRRACDNPAPSNGGASCAPANTNSESRGCGNAVCPAPVRKPVVPVSSHQGPACTKTDDRACKRYERSKKWYCTRGWVKNNCAQMCGLCTSPGSQVAVPKTVVPKPIPRRVNGNWGSWSAYGWCSKTCGDLTMTRTRVCNNPAPSHGGRSCPGSATEARSCNLRPCPVVAPVAPQGQGQVSGCTDHSVCKSYKNMISYACTQRWMKNNCKNMCGLCKQTVAVASKPRVVTPRPVNGKWGRWSAYGRCSSTCGRGTRTRTRACNNPAPKHGGRNCPGSASEARSCNTRACTVAVNGNWGRWSAYGMCSKSCGGGTQEKRRVCDNPAPSNGGASCAGRDSESQSCANAACRVNGNWGRWSAYGRCSKTCGSHGTQRRTRVCNNPAPTRGGRYCPGAAAEARSCNTRACAVVVQAPVTSHGKKECARSDARQCNQYKQRKSYYCARYWWKRNCAQMCDLCTPRRKAVAVVPKKQIPAVTRAAIRSCSHPDHSGCNRFKRYKNTYCSQDWLQKNCADMCGNCVWKKKK